MQQKRSKNASDKRGQTKTSVLGEELRYGPHFIWKFRKAAKPVRFFRVVELKDSEKLRLVVKAGFQSGATEVITSEQNHSTILSSLNR